MEKPQRNTFLNNGWDYKGFDINLRKTGAANFLTPDYKLGGIF